MTSQKLVGRKKRTARRLILLYAAFGAFLALCAAFLWFSFNPLDIPAPPAFSGYRSSVKLGDSSVTKTELTRVKNDAIDGWYYEYKLTYSPSGVVMYERDTSEYPGFYNSCADVAPPSGDYESTCTSHALKNGRYIVVVNKYKGSVFGLDVEARIGTTSLYVMIPDSRRTAYMSYDWQAFFNSLTPVDLKQLPYQTLMSHTDGP